eukprot:GHVL01014461.1.p1 GENE.GHVL01014461.1~~GHVL01014461.1.p1  ORF type:complete len:394 (-),score=72.39 GHVL01014461.1:16-1197(-)
MSSCDGIVCLFGCLSLFPGVKKSIVSGIAFCPPKPAGYAIKGRKLWLLSQSGELEMVENLPHGITIHPRVLTTRENTETDCILLKYPGSQWTMIFCHGNSTDVGFMFPHLLNLCYQLKVNILGLEYSGYGSSLDEINPSESHIYADIDAAYEYLINTEKCQKSSIILYGQSVGSAAVIDLASREDVAGVIIHSGLKSGLSVIHDVKAVHWFDAFQNIKKIRQVRAVCFFIHGTHDNEVSFEHGLELYEAAPNKVDPWWVQGGSHNDIEILFQNAYYIRLGVFIRILQEESTLHYSPKIHKYNTNSPMINDKTRTCPTSSSASTNISQDGLYMIVPKTHMFHNKEDNIDYRHVSDARNNIYKNYIYKNVNYRPTQELSDASSVTRATSGMSSHI